MARRAATVGMVAALVLAAVPVCAESRSYFAPKDLPDGWYVLRARDAGSHEPTSTRGDDWTYYEGSDRMLAVGNFGLGVSGLEACTTCP